MRTIYQGRRALLLVAAVFVAVTASGQKRKAAQKAAKQDVWGEYFAGHVHFKDNAPQTEGSKTYNAIISDPAAYITERARMVLRTLYFSPADSIVPVNNIYYSLEDTKGVSAKNGGNGEITIWYSTRHIEKSFAQQDTAKLHYETTGVLTHELTHAYQLEPQGIGSYGTNKVFWAFIEGMADAVRLENGCFGADDRPKGGNYMDGYRTCGFFLVWLKNNKDADFLKKFNRSTLEIIPWSFDAAIKKVLGPQYQIDALWNEYQVAVGDIQS